MLIRPQTSSPYAQGVSQENNQNPRTNSMNYIRNSVKATVDAYDGSVTLMHGMKMILF